jgi:hypothetical protein
MVRGYGIELIGYGQETTVKKILLTSRAVKRKIVASRGFHFQAKVEDLHLKYCILFGETLKTRVQGIILFF